MSGSGNCFGNAPTESLFGSLKMEWVHHAYYEARAQARTDIFIYIEAFYNHRRGHSTLGYVSPVAFEDAYYSNASIILN